MVLLVVDTQKLLMNNKLFEFDIFSKNIKKLILTAKRSHVEVIYIVHDDGVDTDLTKGKEGFEVFDAFKPVLGDKIFAKSVNSAFRDTGLLSYLKDKNETDVIVVGLQTDKCIDATIKCGFEHGFRMIVPSYSNSTVDNVFMRAETSYKYYNEFMWNGRYAECISVSETIKRMSK